MKTSISVIILLILTCCASTSNSRLTNFYFDESPNKVSKSLLKSISTSSQKYDLTIFYTNNDSKKIDKFLEGVKGAYFFQKSIGKNKKSIKFSKIIKDKNFCNTIKSLAGKKIIVHYEKLDSSSKKCFSELNSDYYLVSLDKYNYLSGANLINLKNQNYLNQLINNENFNLNNFVFISKNIAELESFNKSNELYSKKISEDSFALINGSKNFESQIASLFELSLSQKRKRDLQREIGNEIKITPRARKDISNVIVSSSSNIANRIVPAFKYNLLFDVEIFNLPNHFDYWNPSSSVDDLNETQGLEYPILLNKINLGSAKFKNYSSEEKIIYSLGFDLINYINSGNGYFGLLGEYSSEENQIKISPLQVSFKDGEIIQKLN
ncbi:hypothetical protein N9T42_00635 [SAR86 cluster bacterium]|nr:hypothetical protein [SAR86 cluster bacterium]